MTTIEANSFEEAQEKLQALQQDVIDLTIKLYSKFDAPPHYLNGPIIPHIYEQPRFLAE
jgi:hypothetical protein